MVPRKAVALCRLSFRRESFLLNILSFGTLSGKERGRHFPSVLLTGDTHVPPNALVQRMLCLSIT